MTTSNSIGLATREVAKPSEKAADRRRTRRPSRSADRRAAIAESIGGRA